MVKNGKPIYDYNALKDCDTYIKSSQYNPNNGSLTFKNKFGQEMTVFESEYRDKNILTVNNSRHYDDVITDCGPTPYQQLKRLEEELNKRAQLEEEENHKYDATIGGEIKINKVKNKTYKIKI